MYFLMDFPVFFWVVEAFFQLIGFAVCSKTNNISYTCLISKNLQNNAGIPKTIPTRRTFGWNSVAFLDCISGWRQHFFASQDLGDFIYACSVFSHFINALNDFGTFFVNHPPAWVNGIVFVAQWRYPNSIGEYSSIDEINYLASKLDDMTSREIEIYEAAIETGDYCGSIQDLINLTESLDCFDYMEGVTAITTSYFIG